MSTKGDSEWQDLKQRKTQSAKVLNELYQIRLGAPLK